MKNKLLLHTKEGESRTQRTKKIKSSSHTRLQENRFRAEKAASGFSVALGDDLDLQDIDGAGPQTFDEGGA